MGWLFAIVFFFPVAWMVFTSFHSEQAAAANPPRWTAPLTLEGYREFFGASTGASPVPELINSATASISST
ncbi:MAG: carbohydrate ABC transporter permease, partial [Sciscionella sp.]